MLDLIDWEPVILSLRVALISLCMVTFSGIGAAYWLRSRDFPGKSALETVFTLPLALPPVVTGFLLLIILGKYGPIGSFLHEFFGVTVIFTPYAAIIAGVIVSFPLMYQSAKAAFTGINPCLEEVARSLGANPRKVLFTITIPLAWPGIAAGMALSFARALGEFGATIMVAGNIPGKTQTLPLAIYFAAESNKLYLAGMYALIISAFTFFMIFAINVWQSGKNKKSE